MRLHKANFAGLTSAEQRSEMKSILAGTWPPLKPLPVFKYETAEYRATIDFDKKRGEWACRKTSLPSNEVQELRGGLREITLALPHGETEIITEGVGPEEPEFERETNRRLQANREWREKYQNGARYFELRELLSERQRTELDDSLRLTLTARQLQFNVRNVADVFEDLSVAGGRFAALIEFAQRKKADPGIEAQPQREELRRKEPQGEGVASEVECAVEREEQSPEVRSGEFGLGLNLSNSNNDALARKQEATERCAEEQEASEPCAGADEFPAVTIRDVCPEQEQAPLAERMAHGASRHFEVERYEAADEDSASLDSADSASLVEDAQPEERHSDGFGGERGLRPRFAEQARRGQAFVSAEGAGRILGSSWRFPALQVSAFQVNLFAILFLFAATSFLVGLTVGRGPLGKRLREPPTSLLITEAKPPTAPDQGDESSPQTPSPPAAGSEDSAGAKRIAAAPAEEKPKENTAGAEESTEVRSVEPKSSSTIESRPTANAEVNSEPRGAMRPVVRRMLPRVSPRVGHSHKAGGLISSARRSHAPFRLTATKDAGPHLPRASTALVTVPSGAGQPVRVNFPTKTIAATSSLAMTSQLSVLVPPAPGFAVGRRPARLEAGELVSFVWPRYPWARERYGWAETIRVRATVGQLGQVQELKFLGGSLSLLPATRAAIRQWRYRPTLLDKRPVETQQDVTIEFRPERYSSQAAAQHPSHN